MLEEVNLEAQNHIREEQADETFFAVADSVFAQRSLALRTQHAFKAMSWEEWMDKVAKADELNAQRNQQMQAAAETVGVPTAQSYKVSASNNTTSSAPVRRPPAGAKTSLGGATSAATPTKPPRGRSGVASSAAGRLRGAAAVKVEQGLAGAHSRSRSPHRPVVKSQSGALRVKAEPEATHRGVQEVDLDDEAGGNHERHQGKKSGFERRELNVREALLDFTGGAMGRSTGPAMLVAGNHSTDISP